MESLMPFVPKSFNNTFKTVVVVARVITVVDPAQWPATDDPAGTAIAGTRRRHRVLMVVAALRFWQDPLAVAKHDAVFLVRIRTAGADQAQRGHGLARKTGGRNRIEPARRHVGRNGLPCVSGGNQTARRRADDTHREHREDGRERAV